MKANELPTTSRNEGYFIVERITDDLTGATLALLIVRKRWDSMVWVHPETIIEEGTHD